MTTPTAAHIGPQVYANKDFVEGFAFEVPPAANDARGVKLLQAAPWGPHP